MKYEFSIEDFRDRVNNVKTKKIMFYEKDFKLSKEKMRDLKWELSKNNNNNNCK